MSDAVRGRAARTVERHDPERLSTPEAALHAFAAAMIARDVDAAAATFSRQACFVTPDATTIRGRDEIRTVLAQMLATCVRVEVELRTMVTAGQVAVGSERWRVSFKHPTSAAFLRSSTSTMVLGEVDGAWKLMVADPWRG